MKPVKVSVPHMGNYGPAFHRLMEGVGAHIIDTPPITRKTIELGSRYSPEFVCLPFKINLGNYIEALEMGTEVLMQAGRAGACRYGYYAEIQEQILKDMGYKFRMLNLFGGGRQYNFLPALLRITGRPRMGKIARAAVQTLMHIMLIDEMETTVRRLRACEKNKGESDHLLAQGLARLKSARNEIDLLRVRRRMKRLFRSVSIANTTPVKVGMVGELYVVMEPRANLDVERKLGSLGVEVVRPMSLSSLLKYAVFPLASRTVMRHGKQFVRNELGAHAGHSVAHAVEFHQRGLDGVVHVYPFTCMPEVSARAILSNVSRTLGIPVLHFSFSEQTGEAGVNTRIETFADMLQRRRKKKTCTSLA